MKNYWLSWRHIVDKLGPFELASPWWISGYAPAINADSVCAAVKAVDVDQAKETIFKAYDVRPETLEFRFCEERPVGWTPYSERFPQADWMEWEALQ